MKRIDYVMLGCLFGLLTSLIIYEIDFISGFVVGIVLIIALLYNANKNDSPSDFLDGFGRVR